MGAIIRYTVDQVEFLKEEMHKHKHPRHGIDKYSLEKITSDFNVLFETTKSEGAIAFKLIDIDKKLNGDRSIKIFVPAGRNQKHHKEFRTNSKGKQIPSKGILLLQSTIDYIREIEEENAHLKSELRKYCRLRQAVEDINKES